MSAEMKAPMFLYSILILLFTLPLLSCSKKQDVTVTPPNPTVKTISFKGVDISFLPEVRKSGINLLNSSGHVEDALLTLKNAGVTVIRLRLFKNPTESTSNFETVKNLTNEFKSMGFLVYLAVYYSDSWADPSQQNKPQEWQTLSFNQLNDSVYAYTKKVMTEIMPDYIQIGNEINNGFLWPDGSFSNLGQMKSLLQSGIKAVREINSKTKVILHFAGYENSTSFYTNLSGIDYNLIGLSYYPVWHGKDLEGLKQAMLSLTQNIGKKMIIAETAYPFTLQWNDWTNNVVGLNSQLIADFPATPQGQKDYLQKIVDIVQYVPDAIGYCYWGADWVSFKGDTATNGSTWENQAFWDFQNKSLPIMEIYK